MAGSNGFGISDILNGGKDDADDYFKILGCSETSTDEQIIAEYRIRALKCHPDKHPGDQNALDQFQKLQEAKETLLDPEKRLKYEKWRQSEMCISYKQWLSMSGRCATTMHWAKPKDQTMIESFADQKRGELEKQFQNMSSSSTASPSSSANNSHKPSNLADVKWKSEQQQAYVWRPEKTTSIYAKFRNYKI